MEFVETSIFTKWIQALLTEDEYRNLQAALATNPKIGDVIPGSGGLRKLRWASGRQHRGKRGGIRVIYSCGSPHRLYMLFAYEKSQQGDLTKQQLDVLKAYIKRGI